MVKRPHYIALGVVVLMVLVFLNLTEKASHRLKLTIGSVFLPFFGLVSTTENLSQRAQPYLQPRRTLIKKLEQLQRTNETLRFQVQQGLAALRENARLRQLLLWRQRQPWKLRLGRVIGRDPANWWRTAQIDLGSRDALKANFPVLTDRGLVGRVSAVGYSRSQVLLLGDPNCQVAAEIVETRDNGVIAPGKSELNDPNIVELTYLPGNSTLKPGNHVITSGLGGIFPKGIPIGQIVDSQSVGYGLYTKARVRLAVDLNHLEDVWVMIR